MFKLCFSLELYHICCYTYENPEKTQATPTPLSLSKLMTPGEHVGSMYLVKTTLNSVLIAIFLVILFSSTVFSLTDKLLFIVCLETGNFWCSIRNYVLLWFNPETCWVSKSEPLTFCNMKISLWLECLPQFLAHTRISIKAKLPILFSVVSLCSYFN